MPKNPLIDPNQHTFNSPDVVAYYHSQSELQDCERHVFETYLKPGMRILDLGVGTGRTTPALSAIASTYVGLDYSEGMIADCRKKFPALEFQVADASDLSAFADDSFDACVFSFNGLDYLYPDQKRLRCLEECRRVLKNGGILIFSSHNARRLFVKPLFKGASWMKSAWRVLRAGYKSLGQAWRMLPSAAFWRGDGYVTDPIHGGLFGRFSTPRRVLSELSQLDFAPLSVLDGNYPEETSVYATPWYYYVFVKSAGNHAAAATAPPRYVSIFLHPKWVMERYYGWATVSGNSSTKVLRKKYGFLTKYLVLAWGTSSEDLEQVLQKLVRDPLSIVVVHNFSTASPPLPPRGAGKTFLPLAAEDRLLNIATFVLDLSKDLDSLWQNMDRNQARYKCQKAEKRGASVRITKEPSKADVDAFFEHHDKMARRKGLNGLDRTSIQRMFAQGDLILASCLIPGTNELAMITVYIADESAYYLHGINNNKGNTGAGHLVHWEMVKYLKQQGFHWYDLGGVAATDPGDGIFRFKESLGGIFVDLGREYQFISPAAAVPYKCYRRLKKNLGALLCTAA